MCFRIQLIIVEKAPRKWLSLNLRNFSKNNISNVNVVKKSTQLGEKERLLLLIW